MKQVFTCSLEEDTVQRIRDFARKSAFRNKSHVVEEAILQFLKYKSKVENLSLVEEVSK